MGEALELKAHDVGLRVAYEEVVLGAEAELALDHVEDPDEDIRLVAAHFKFELILCHTVLF